jgi:hypothetical protein
LISNNMAGFPVVIQVTRERSPRSWAAVRIVLVRRQPLVLRKT